MRTVNFKLKIIKPLDYRTTYDKNIPERENSLGHYAENKANLQDKQRDDIG